ncbi:MAG: SH3 domain-containing protein [Candidatus Omnitrophica bacterium]|nr:SH3 domain-containing protein [Candidatus Omnitrophota bacterium]
MKIFYILLIAIFFSMTLVSAFDLYEVANDKAQIRVDSTSLSGSLGFFNQGDSVEVVGEKFDWYRVVLPKETTCYVYSKLIEVLDGGMVRISATNVNLRYQPSLEAPIIGKALKDEVFSLLGDNGEWLKINNNSKARGWVHKKFLKKQDSSQNLALLEERIVTSDTATIYNTITILSQLGKNKPELLPRFLEKAKRLSLKPASAYLDILQNILEPKDQKKAYFYQAQNNALSDQDIQRALSLFQTMIETKNISQ